MNIKNKDMKSNRHRLRQFIRFVLADSIFSGMATVVLLACRICDSVFLMRPQGNQGTNGLTLVLCKSKQTLHSGRSMENVYPANKY